eukprot:1158811-Alexandrium_andersonii.AAC.1
MLQSADKCNILDISVPHISKRAVHTFWPGGLAHCSEGIGHTVSRRQGGRRAALGAVRGSGVAFGPKHGDGLEAASGHGAMAHGPQVAILPKRPRASVKIDATRNESPEVAADRQ